jgi:hypothetical protein
LGTNHVVSIVLFARVQYNDEEVQRLRLFEDPTTLCSEQGTFYRDFYKVVIDWETRSDWHAVLVAIKEEWTLFQQHVLEYVLPARSSFETGSLMVEGKTILCGSLTTAMHGNVLEAINLALNIFDKHYIDRDLSRTGLSVVVVTPSNGIFHAPRSLIRLTNERMIEVRFN